MTWLRLRSITIDLGTKWRRLIQMRQRDWLASERGSRMRFLLLAIRLYYHCSDQDDRGIRIGQATLHYYRCARTIVEQYTE